MTPDQWIYIGAGLAGAWWLHQTFLARPATVPAPAAPPPPVVRARVVDDHPTPLDSRQLLGLLHNRIETEGIDLAFQRKAAQMIEAKAAAFDIPWATQAAPKSDPPKA